MIFVQSIHTLEIMKKHLLLFLLSLLTQASFAQDWTRTYSTYFGGSQSEDGFALVVDNDSNVYIAGSTRSQDFPITDLMIQESFGGGNTDGFIAKFNSNHNLEWATYIGGSSEDAIRALVIDDDAVYYIGNTESNDINMSSTTLQNGYGGGISDMMLGKLSFDGELIWSSYFGGNDSDEIDDAAFHDGKLYLMGNTRSQNLSMSSNAFRPEFTGVRDGILAVINNDGILEHCTYFGGNEGDFPGGISVSESGYIVLSGQTDSTTDLATSGAFSEELSSDTNGFLILLNPSYGLDWSTYFGGNVYDAIQEVLIVDNKTITVAGLTFSTDLPVSPSAIQSEYLDTNEAGDGFIAQFNLQGELVWCSYFGGNNYDSFTGLKSIQNRLVFSGITSSGDLNTVNAFQPNHSQYSEGFILILDNSQSVEMLTYYGGTGNDRIRSMDVHGNVVYAVGDAHSADSFNTEDAYQPNINGNYPDTFYSIFEEEKIVIGIQEKIKTPHIELFPNPATTQLQVSSQSQIDHIKIYNIAGKMMMTTPINSKQGTLILEHLPEGIYLARITTHEGVQNLPLIISH